MLTTGGLDVLRQIEEAQRRRWESFLRYPTQREAYLSDKEIARERRGARLRIEGFSAASACRRQAELPHCG